MKWLLALGVFLFFFFFFLIGDRGAAFASPTPDPVVEGDLSGLRLPIKPSIFRRAKADYMRGDYARVIEKHKAARGPLTGPAFDALAALAHDKLREYEAARALLIRVLSKLKQKEGVPDWVFLQIVQYDRAREALKEIAPPPSSPKPSAPGSDPEPEMSDADLVSEPQAERKPTPAGDAPVAKATSGGRPIMHAIKRVGDIAIDGRLDDAAWKNASPVEITTQTVPDEQAKPTEPTRFRVLYDDSYVYFGLECPQQKSPLVTRMTTHDDAFDTDSIEINLVTGESRTAAVFGVNASGVRAEGFRSDDGDLSLDWDAPWKAEARPIKDGGYTVEVQIPLAILELTRSGPQSWGLQVRRFIAARLETDEWAYIPRSEGEGAEVDRYGTLEGLDVTSHAQLQIVPYLGVGLTRSDDDPQRRGQLGHRLAAGADITWKPNRSLTLAAAINPDFSQVRAEQVLLNLGTTEIALPERRPFFLQGLTLFQPIGLKLEDSAALLYTRRIGARPSEPLSADDTETIIESPQPTPVFGAAKTVASLGGNHSVGAFVAMTGANSVNARSGAAAAAGESGRERLVASTSTFSLLRWQYTPTDLRVGLTAGATNPLEYLRLPGTKRPIGPNGAVLCPEANVVTSNQRCFSDAYVAGGDVRWLFGDKAYFVDAVGYSSVLENGLPRVVRDGTTIRSGDAGAGGRLRIGRQSAEHWLWQIEGSGASNKLDLNDMGYLERPNVLHTAGELKYRVLSPTDWANEVGVAVGTRVESNTRFLSLERSVYSRGEFFSTAGHTASVELTGSLPYFDDREVGNGTALERTQRLGVSAFSQTNMQKALAAGFTWNQQFFAGGAFINGGVSLVGRPSSFAFIEVAPSVTYTTGEPRFARVSDDGADYIFGRLSVRSVNVTTRVGISFTPRISFEGFVRAFAAATSYGDQFSFPTTGGQGGRPVIALRDLVPSASAPLPSYETATVFGTLVVRWEYLPGSEIYLILTRTQTAAPALSPPVRPSIDLLAAVNGPTNDVIFVKASYSFH